MITAPLAFLTQSNAVNNDDAALRGWVKEIIGNRDIPLPTAAQDWALLRRWHILIQSLTLLSQWENAKLAQSSQSWTPLGLHLFLLRNIQSLTPLLATALDQHQAILQPLLESPALSSLAHVFSTLSLEITPPTSIPALLSLDLVPSFLSTYQTLENQLLDSTLQIDQLSNLRTDIEIGLTTQIELQRYVVRVDCQYVLQLTVTFLYDIEPLQSSRKRIKSPSKEQLNPPSSSHARRKSINHV